MLHLKTPSPERWLAKVRSHLDELLLDHAHCEKKAAGTAMNLLFAYVQNEELAREMTVIVNEELEHFNQVLDILAKRNIPWRRIKPSEYGRKLNDQVRKGEPERAIDRLIVAGLIEARSCERFDILRAGIEDVELATFYDSLFESEARHHAVYLRLASRFADEVTVRLRLDELSRIEADLIAANEPIARMHS